MQLIQLLDHNTVDYCGYIQEYRVVQPVNAVNYGFVFRLHRITVKQYISILVSHQLSSIQNRFL